MQQTFDTTLEGGEFDGVGELVTGSDGVVYREIEVREQDRFLPVANIARIMKKILPNNAKIAKDGKETIQNCVSEFISFITSEASEKCQQEKRKTINGDDILWAMSTLGMDKYIEPLRTYLLKYRESVKGERPEKKSAKRDLSQLQVNSSSGIAPINQHQRTVYAPPGAPPGSQPQQMVMVTMPGQPPQLMTAAQAQALQARVAQGPPPLGHLVNGKPQLPPPGQTMMMQSGIPPPPGSIQAQQIAHQQALAAQAHAQQQAALAAQQAQQQAALQQQQAQQQQQQQAGLFPNPNLSQPPQQAQQVPPQQVQQPPPGGQVQQQPQK